MIRKNGKLLFEPINKIKILEGELRVPGIIWGDKLLGWRAKYLVGNLVTDLKQKVEALQLIEKSFEFYYFKVGEGKQYDPNDMPDNKKYKIDVSYNCYGYCFADGKFFIEDPTQILKDEYEYTEKLDKADKIMLVSVGAIDNAGNENRAWVHGVNVNKDKTISYKPGINALITNVGVGQMNGSYNFNVPLYYKAKKKTILIDD